MPLVGVGFDHDVFVSYSHGDMGVRAEPLLKTWTRAFVERLKEDLRLGLSERAFELDVWYDAELQGNVELTAELKRRVKRSALLVIVITPSYLGSSWCTDERQWFEDELQRRGNAMESVFVVRALPTDTTKWPAKFKDERGHPVVGWSFLPERHEPSGHPFGWPEPSGEDRAFFIALGKLSMAMRERLEAIKPVSKPPPTVVPRSRRVFLALSTDDVAIQREELCCRLREHVEVVPDAKLAFMELPTRMAADLSSCQLFVQLLGVTPGRWDQDHTGPVAYQYHLAQEHGIPVMTWWNPHFPLKAMEAAFDENYRQLIQQAQPTLEQEIANFAQAAIAAVADREDESFCKEIKIYLRAASYDDSVSTTVIQKLEALHYLVFPKFPPRVDGNVADMEAERKRRLQLYAEIDVFLLLRAVEAYWVDQEIASFVHDRQRLKQQYRKDLPAAVLDTIGDAPKLPPHYKIAILPWTNGSAAPIVREWIEQGVAAERATREVSHEQK